MSLFIFFPHILSSHLLFSSPSTNVILVKVYNQSGISCFSYFLLLSHFYTMKGAPLKKGPHARWCSFQSTILPMHSSPLFNFFFYCPSFPELEVINSWVSHARVQVVWPCNWNQISGRSPEALWWQDSSQELVCKNEMEIAEKAGMEDFVPETQRAVS